MGWAAMKAKLGHYSAYFEVEEPEFAPQNPHKKAGCDDVCL